MSCPFYRALCSPCVCTQAYIHVAQLAAHVDECVWMSLMDRRGDTQGGKLGRVLLSFCLTRRLTPSTCHLPDYVSALAVAGT